MKAKIFCFLLFVLGVSLPDVLYSQAQRGFESVEESIDERDIEKQLVGHVTKYLLFDDRGNKEMSCK